MIQARKRFGQHFLVNPQILHEMVAAIHPGPDEHFVEIGPGHGELTQLLLPFIKKMDVVEIDRDLVVALQQKFSQYPQLAIHACDVLKFNFHEIQNEQLLRVCGNLPYNISTPLLFKLFAHIERIKDMHFLLQKEVVERLTATVGSSHYGRLSVMSQYFCQNSELFTVEPNAFRPPPKVYSSYVRMIPQQPMIKAMDYNQFNLIVREAFSHRRKTLKNALKHQLDEEIFATLKIDSSIRPQEVSVTDYVRISNEIGVRFSGSR